MSVALLSQARKSECGMAHNTLVVLMFVRTVNIPNLSLLPCLEVPSMLVSMLLGIENIVYYSCIRSCIRLTYGDDSLEFSRSHDSVSGILARTSE